MIGYHLVSLSYFIKIESPYFYLNKTR